MAGKVMNSHCYSLLKGWACRWSHYHQQCGYWCCYYCWHSRQPRRRRYPSRWANAWATDNSPGVAPCTLLSPPHPIDSPLRVRVFQLESLIIHSHCKISNSWGHENVEAESLAPRRGHWITFSTIWEIPVTIFSLIEFLIFLNSRRELSFRLVVDITRCRMMVRRGLQGTKYQIGYRQNYAATNTRN